MRKDNRTRRLLTASTVLVAWGVMPFADGAVAQSATASTPAQSWAGTKQFINVRTGKCLSVAEDDPHFGKDMLIQVACDTDEDGSTKWTIFHVGEGYWMLNFRTRKCAMAFEVDFTPILYQGTCDKEPGFLWNHTYKHGYPGLQLVSARNGMCMTVGHQTLNGVSYDDKWPLHQATCDNSQHSQYWFEQPA